MDWSSVAKAAEGIAPALATMLGGPLAGGAVTALEGLFGIAPGTATPDTLTAAIAADPNAAMKLKQAEMDFAIKQRDQDIETLKTQLADIQSARARQTEHEKATGKSDLNLYALAWLIVGGFFGLTGALLYFSYTGKPITDQTGVLFMLVGTLATAFGGVIGYFFGSSASSAAKTELLAKAEPIK